MRAFVRRVILSWFVVCLVARCADVTGPNELECTNTPVPPNRFAIPHRWSDTTLVYQTAPGPDSGRVIGTEVRWLGDKGSRQCWTLSDSLDAAYLDSVNHKPK